ncbi:unnamed protein product [Paramecium primaurelia]|uniref:Uncharacterized protein n=1 Tax=Paramecium primaurelia TaxID=5886 RepID=A0A8S1QUZ1_PARPR|nr:unnamed protein product [Paramecium primaurelia]
MEYSEKDQIWNVIQKIKVLRQGYRLCFINDNQFTFQPWNYEQMHIYDLNSSNKEFVKTNEIIVKSGSTNCDYLFPQQYLKSKCLLIRMVRISIQQGRKRTDSLQQSKLFNLVIIQFMVNQVKMVNI